MNRPPDPRAGGSLVLDFDGTVCVDDVGNLLFDRVTAGRAREVVASWKSGEFGSRRCLIAECALARASRDEVLAFALERPLDPGFPGFLRRAASAGWSATVASDGLDLYIHAILAREGIDLPVEANRLRTAGDRFLPSFPYAGRGCGRCGNCKGGAVASRRDHGPVVFVGNGLSDRCGARAADWVFAKDDLSRFCREESVPFTPFRTFGDLEEWIAPGAARREPDS